MEEYLDSFLFHYKVSALWSSTDEDGEPLDRDYDITDLSQETCELMYQDCKEFVESNWDALCEIHSSATQSGHDFWLTRNRHGAGFWDRGDGEAGDRLTDASDVYGEVDLYIGDDGMLHQA